MCMKRASLRTVIDCDIPVLQGDIRDQPGVITADYVRAVAQFGPMVEVRAGYRDQPGVITADYVRAVAQFGPMVEVRAGYRTQDLPIFVRMIDKDSYWTFENGLPTLVTTLLQMNMNGYPLVLPDMIGGNGYSEAPSKELFIRWLQANTFMPSMQFSYYAPEIISACKKAVSDGAPVNPPIWWIAPNDTTAHGIWDEYLLGENILVAPILEHAAIERDVYLPEGTWLQQGDPSKRVQGGDWIRKYPAPLNTLPYFVKIL
ncbi:Alpha-glucosidase [Operophtera brumata]|uniref:Alpha-glucosidase n=1 Tax=Operophtera brumata TaxID=104452 RepID=A0A0L7LAK7_OPEBR|nr:Alpha-glucosidase [Operophtera brumata]